MGLRGALAHPRLRIALAVAMLLRVPGAALPPALTLLAVLHLHAGYGAAGAVTATFALCSGLVAPIRSRAIDRGGVRRALGPLLPIGGLAWVLAPHVSYVALVATALVAGLGSTPVWGVARQLVLGAAPLEHRRAALSLDSVGTEVAFIVGPLAGITLATGWDPRWAVTVAGCGLIAGAALLCLFNPAIGAPGEVLPMRSRMIAGPIARILALVLVATVVLVGTDTLLLALLRQQHAVHAYALAAAMSAAGSMAGGLGYGALRRSIGPVRLTAVLALVTVLLALPLAAPLIVVAAFVCGTACAPALTAITEAIAAHVAPARRTEAFGWYATANTLGGAIASPGVGALIDTASPHFAALALALLALSAVAVVAALR